MAKAFKPVGRPPGHIVLAILAALESRGPMTRANITRVTGLANGAASPVLSRLVASGRAHIPRYVRKAAGMRNYLRAVYAAGPGVNAEKPAPLTGNEQGRKREKPPVVTSVFDLAITRAQWREKVRAVRTPSAGG